MEEIFKDIPGYEGIYQVSNFGNVRSLINTHKNVRKIPKLLKPSIDYDNYFMVNLRKNNNKKTYRIHQLVAITFLNHVPSGLEVVVNHIDNNPQNNHIDNLELVSNRYNSSCHKTDVGIYLNKEKNKWHSRITINYKPIHLGHFSDKEDALKQYNKALQNLDKYNGNPKQFRLLLNKE